MSVNFVEPFFTCLLASMIWAPIVFFIARKFAKDEPNGLDDKLWPSALVIAAAPALFAPIAAALGLSLRTPPPALPMVEPVATAAATFAPVATTPAVVVSTPTMTLAEILEAAALMYFYGFLLFLLLGLFRMAHFSYRVRYAYDLDEPKLEAGLEDWRRRMGVKQRPRYAFTDAVASVCVHGIFRPVILMPEGLLERVSIDDAILMGAHEMAHIKRRDTALFSLCTAVKAVFWFNPFMQHIAARANLAAEQAADALVLACGAHRKSYAQCFVHGLRFAASQRQDARFAGRELVPSFTPFDKKSRRARLDAILSGTGGEPLIGIRHKIGLGVSIVAAAGIAFAQAAFAVAPKPAEETLSATPVEGPVTLTFGKEVTAFAGAEPKTHSGVDIKARRGTPVRAAGAGKVIDATSRYRGNKAWGNVVVIDHGHGLVTRYAHLDSFIVQKGDMVEAGDVIAAVGSTGRSTGPHLHFEVLQDGLAIDPAPILARAPLLSAKPKAPPRPVTATAPRSAADPVIAPTPSFDIAIVPDVDVVPDVAPPVAPAPSVEVKRVYKVKPAKAPEPPAPTASLNARIERQLAGKFDGIDESIQLAFKDFGPFVHAKEFESFTEELSESLQDMDFELPDFSGYTFFIDDSGENVTSFVFSGAHADEMKKAERRHKEAMKEAKRHRKQRSKEHEKAIRALEAAERDHEEAMRALKRVKRQGNVDPEEIEQARLAHDEARRDLKQAKRDHKQAMHDEAREHHERAQRERAQHYARAEAARERARERAEQQRERAQERAERNRERAQERAERERERAEQLREREQERAEQARERAQAERERQWQRAEEEMQRAIERAEEMAERQAERAARDWERLSENQRAVISEKEILELREKAVKEAQADLERELDEIKRLRAELKKNNGN